MRVRISYSVELEHVPAECERMLYNAAAELHELTSEVSDLCALVHKKDVTSNSVSLDEKDKNQLFDIINEGQN